MPEEKTKVDYQNMPEIPEEDRAQWCYENVKRLIVYVNTLESWRFAKFKSLDELIAEGEANAKENDDSSTDRESGTADTDSNKPA
tara:strand:+ start:3070 stop:3324 length:255 start_codon:yes stop_codon:yes gene_type:complete